MGSTLDDCLELVQQGSIAFAVGSIGFFYLSDQATALHRWFSLLREQNLRGGGRGFGGREERSDLPRPNSESRLESLRERRREENLALQRGRSDTVPLTSPTASTAARMVTRVIVRHASSVDGRTTFLDGVTFYYSNVPNGINFGGIGGSEYAPFELREEEWICEVRGRKSGTYVHEIQFVTNAGRVSPSFGDSAIGEPFTFKLAQGGCIGGLDVAVSINGWLRSIRGVIAVSQINTAPQELPLYIRENGIVRAHQRRVRKRLRFVHISVIVYASFLIFAMSNFVLDILQSPVEIHLASAGSDRKWRSNVQIPEELETVADSLSFADGDDMVRWTILDMNYESSDPEKHTVGILVKELVGRSELSKSSPNDISFDLNLPRQRTGIVRRFDSNSHGLVFDKLVESSKFSWFWSEMYDGVVANVEPDKGSGESISDGGDSVTDGGGGSSSSSSSNNNNKMKGRIIQMYPKYYVDESFSPLMIYMFSAVILLTFAYTLKVEWRQTLGFDDPVIQRFRSHASLRNMSIQDIARQIDEEVLEEGTLVLPWSSCLVAVTRNWLIKTSYLGMDAIAISDARLVDLRMSGRWIMGELVDIFTLRIESRCSVAQGGHHRGRAAYFFDVALPRVHFNSLQSSFIDRINRMQDEQVQQRESDFLQAYYQMLVEKAQNGQSFPVKKEDARECFGFCGKQATVLIRKLCASCEERDACQCEASWCHECLLRWWFVKNRTRTEISEQVEARWQATCPQCRSWFCLNDVIPREDLHDLEYIRNESNFALEEEDDDDDDEEEGVDDGKQKEEREDDKDNQDTEKDEAAQHQLSPNSQEVKETENNSLGPSEQPANNVAERRARAASAAERRRLGVESQNMAS